MLQSQALDILKTGANVFLTGEPGSGKTHTINAYTQYLREHGIEHAITASTGIAATQINGRTIHSWSGIGISKFDRYAVDRIVSNERVVKRVNKVKVLVIDEISMLGPQTLSMVDAVLQGIKRSSEPFGGLQVVFVGDFFQLPPVSKKQKNINNQGQLFSEKVGTFAYDSPSWNRLAPIVCYLTEQHRQDDDTFLKMLGAIRENRFGGEHINKLEIRSIKYEHAPEDAPKLYSHNLDVDKVNNEMLRKLSGDLKTFTMSSRGSKPLVETLKKGCLSPEKLCLKVGATVMFTKNSTQYGFVNGTLGTIEEFGNYGNPIVKTRSGERITVEVMQWEVKDGNQVLATIEQMPLRLAWAITVHKSQGMSLDEAVMDLSQVFEYGQGYVALSRVRKLSGVYLLGYNPRAFQVHPEVLEKDKEFRRISEEISGAFSKLSASEMKKMLDNFIRFCGGTLNAEKNKTSGRYDKIREKYPNAYRPWKAEDDEGLENLFLEGVPIAELAENFGRKKGAITSRLVKLGLIEV